MTKTEFDNFLAPLGLTWEFTGDPVTDCSEFAIGPGWYDATTRLITDLIALGWNKKLAQVKVKFGHGRFYIGQMNCTMHDRIVEWEAECGDTCDKCGSKQFVTHRNNRVLCEDCRTINTHE